MSGQRLLASCQRLLARAAAACSSSSATGRHNGALGFASAPWQSCGRAGLPSSPPSSQHALWPLQFRSFSATFVPSAPLAPHFTRLDNLACAPGSVPERKRWGRGDASGRGAYCGRGVKGQKSRKGNKPGLLFDGGTKALRKSPKHHAKPSNPVVYRTLNLDKLSSWLAADRLPQGEVLTMKELRDSGAVAKTIRWGVKLLGRGGSSFSAPVHLQVSACSAAAKAAVEAAGGSVTTVYYTKLGLHALLKPENFAKKGRQLPGAVRSWPPRDAGKFDVVGQITPSRELPASMPPAPRQRESPTVLSS